GRHADALGAGVLGGRSRLDRSEVRVYGGGDQAGGEGGDEVDGYLVPEQSLAAAEGGPGDHGADVAGGVEGGAGDRADDEDDSEEDRRDGHAEPTGRGPAVGGGGEHHEDAQEGADQLGEERMPGIARGVAEHAEAGVDTGLPEDAPDPERAGNGAGELGDDQSDRVGPGQLPRGGEGEGDGRVDLAAGDVPDRVDHRDDHHHERERDDAQLRHRERHTGGLGDHERRGGGTGTAD